MSAKDHYDRHLGNFYSWLSGDFSLRQKEFQQFLEANGILPQQSGVALDLGAAHGIQSISLASLGFYVKAIDFNKTLLNELEHQKGQLAVTCVEDDIRAVKKYGSPPPEIIICWGDTLTHLDDQQDIQKFISDCCDTLATGGKLILSFRDYTTPLEGNARFIPVKSDDSRILTCMLEYFPQHVRVNDLLYVKTASGWQQKVSAYQKVRIAPGAVEQMLYANSLRVIKNETARGLTVIIAQK